MNITVLDIIIIVIIAASAVWGIFKGFIRQIVSIAALLLGIWCACRFTTEISDKIKGFFSLDIADNMAHIITFAVIFIIVLILAHFIGMLIEKIIKLSMLGWLNRLLGFIFGGIKAAIILSIAVYLVNYLNKMFHIIPQETLGNSKAYTFLEQFQQQIFPFLEKIFFLRKFFRVNFTRLLA